VLVGNKTDLHQERSVTFEEGKRLAEQWKAVFVETSAKQNESVDEIFLQLLSLIEKESNGSNPKQQSSCVVS
jgi:Ras family protein